MGIRDMLNLTLGAIWSYLFVFSLTKDFIFSTFLFPAGVAGTAGAILLFHNIFGQTKVNSSMMTGRSVMQKLSIFLMLMVSSCVAITLFYIGADSEDNHKALIMFMGLAIIFANHIYDWVYSEPNNHEA